MWNDFLFQEKKSISDDGTPLRDLDEAHPEFKQTNFISKLKPLVIKKSQAFFSFLLYQLIYLLSFRFHFGLD